MSLLSVFQRRDRSSEPAPSAPEEVIAARTRARRRLIGAAVLLAIGVIGFPLVFETQPRPIPIDIPIEIPRKEGAPALVLPPRRNEALRPAAPAAPAAPPAEAPVEVGTAAASPASATASAPAEATRAPVRAEAKAPLPKGSEPVATRLVVQVGAYTEPDRLRAARLKVEQLGLKTYTQVVEADGVQRTRVRVGPFASRQEAEGVAARIKAAGLPVAILAL